MALSIRTPIFFLLSNGIVLLLFSSSQRIIRTSSSFALVGVPRQKNPSAPSCVSSSSRVHSSSNHDSSLEQAPQRQQGDKRIQQSSKQKGNGTTKKKTARFRQSVHAASPPLPSPSSSSSSSSVETTKNLVNKDRMWKSKRSIEDLEASLSNRYGTDARKWSREDGDEDDDNDNDNDALDYRKQLPVFGARPVRDPWEQQPTKKQQQQRRTRQPRIDLSHLIADQPVGGRGTNANLGKDLYEKDDEDEFYANLKDDDDDDDEDDEDGDDQYKSRTSFRSNSKNKPDPQQSFFFRPKATTLTTTQTTSQFRIIESDKDNPKMPNRNAKQPPNGETFVVKNKERPAKQPKPALQPLKDEYGNPLYLTTQQAQRNFEAMTRSVVLEEDNNNNNNFEEDENDTDDDESSRWSTATTTWQAVGITALQLLRNLQAIECDTPLAVQTKACPAILDMVVDDEGDDDGDSNDNNNGLKNRDVVVGTYTGSGKTLAFLVPLIQRMLQEDSDDNKNKKQSNKALQAIIIAPGRELASQIVSVARALLQGTDHSVLLAIGGTTYSRNVEMIRKTKPSLLVGTPGRLAELVVGRPGESSGRLAKSIQQVQTVVLDEFDALLEYKAHAAPTQALLSHLKSKRQDLQCILCSATASDMLDNTNNSNNNSKLQQYLRPGYVQAMADQDDILVTPAGNSGNGNAVNQVSTTRVSRTVIHGVVHVPHPRLALETLRRILHTEPVPQQILVFCENSRKVDIVVDKLQSMGIVAAPLHGGRGSEKTDRAEVSKALREGYVGLVVCTELAARGLDAPLLTHVINLDLPTDGSHYAHRAGRCGRGGRPGVVLNLTTEAKERNVPKRFADKLGIEMYTVEPRNGKLNLVEPTASTNSSSVRD